MLGWFASDFFAKSPYLAAPLVALGIFFVVFTVVSVRALLMGREHRERMASLPLEADDE